MQKDFIKGIESLIDVESSLNMTRKINKEEIIVDKSQNSSIVTKNLNEQVYENQIRSPKSMFLKLAAGEKENTIQPIKV